MKNKQTNYFRILAIGLLIMNAGHLSNLLLHTQINGDLIDFMRGLGVALVFWGAYKIAKNKKSARSNDAI